MEITWQLRCILVCQFPVPFSKSELHYKCFSDNDMFFMTLGLRFLWYVYITYASNVTITYHFFFVTVKYFYDFIIRLFLFWCSYVFFYDVRITLHFGTFKLRIEVTLQLRSVLVRHCDVFFITSQLRYLFVRCSYIFEYVRITI